jgi:hypothetical protein
MRMVGRGGVNGGARAWMGGVNGGARAGRMSKA